MKTLKDRIAEVKATQAAELAKQSDTLASNDTFINYMAGVEVEQDIITSLDNIMTTVNAIPTITTQDGNKYKVNCFSVAEQHFGPVMARVLGLVNIAGAMFTDERKQAFTRITNVSHLVFTNAKEAIGSPAYFSKGTLTPATNGTGSAEAPLTAILLTLGVPLGYLAKVNSTSIKAYFTTELNKARLKDEAFGKAAQLDDTEFTLED